MGIKKNNQEKILKMLHCHGALSISSVMKVLHLSEASVRRYFAEMEEAGLVLRYHGGIRILTDKGYSGYQFNEASSAFVAAKHKVGTPNVEGAKVSATVLKNGKGKKIVVLKYKSKKDSKKKLGHRQPYTKVQINTIEG